MAACVHLLHRWCLVSAAETVSSLAKLPKLALGERYVRVPAATMRVAHTFEVVQQKKVAAVVRQGNIDPVFCCLVYFRSNSEPWNYLHMKGGVGVLLHLLVSPAALRLGIWGGECHRRVFPMTGYWGRFGGASTPGRATSLLKFLNSPAAASPKP